MLPRAAALLLLLLLGSCAAPVSREPGGTQRDWAQHSALLAQLERWTASGKLALRTRDYAESASILWQQSGSHSAVQLSGPMGLNATTLESDGRLLEIRQGEEHRTLDLSSPDAAGQGWELPLTALPHWLKGLPAPGLAVETLELDESHALLHTLVQDGWEVRYESYGRFSDITLPTRLQIARGDTSARVIIRDWQAPPP
jgi:outer membrane lipoprotein LolB